MRADAIAAQLQKKLYKGIEDANFLVMGAPPVRGLGTTGGFKIMIEDRGNNGLGALQEQTDNLVQLGNQLENRQPGLTRLMSVFGKHATVVRQHRPHQVQDHGRGAERRFRYPPN